jgi:2-C-methyl-D-erythritol 4-phosphate cytidylyltransferase
VSASGVWSIVVAGGSASRFGRPKQFAPLGGRTVLEHALDAARRHAEGVVLVLFAAVIEAVRAGADGAVPGVPLSDTVKRVRDGEVVETVERSSLVAVQTPQAFRAAALRRAHAAEPEATDDAGLLEAIGARVAVVPGDPANLKLTRPDDLVTAAALLAARASPAATGAEQPGGETATGARRPAQVVTGPGSRGRR